MPPSLPAMQISSSQLLTQSDMQTATTAPALGTPLLPEALPPLLFVVDESGCLHKLEWSVAEEFGIQLAAWLGQSLNQLVINFDALGLTFSNELSTPTAEPWQLQFATGQLTGIGQLCPLSLASGPGWMGALKVIDWLPKIGTAQSTHDVAEQQLTQLTWSIRRTLDLETIWQQTLEELAAIFDLDWAVFCTYDPQARALPVMAKVETPTAPCPLADSLSFEDYPSLPTVLRTPAPHILSNIDASVTPTMTTEGGYLVSATRHHGEPNGVILLKSLDTHRWQGLVMSLLQAVLDQGGSAIAHAHLFRDAQGLADELQSANQRLRQKHHELEEARHIAEEASRLKSEFLANTSHELRTPLNGMIGFLRLILDGMADDPDEQEEFLREAHKSAIHLLNLINDVLDIAKIEAGKMQIDMSPVKLSELFADVENFTRPQAERKDLQFAIHQPLTRDEIVINGNYQRLLQVILNLGGNAIKFTHEGHITISAEIKFQKVQFQEQEWPGLVKVSVADSGIGVSLEKQDRLFQTFSQVDGERTRQYGGTGLGLAISQRLVEAMGGVVQFISMGDGLGSTVTFTTLLYQEPVLIE